MTKYAAHPTLYKGILFRSRLEARYACYFDQRGWAWTYEPYDLHGYSPDFSLTTQDLSGVLVEVKPATKYGHLTAPIGRIIRTGWKGYWLVTGADPDIAILGKGRQSLGRVYLGSQDPSAWAAACNITQWMPTPNPPCLKCGQPNHFLHHAVCRGT